MSGGEWRSYVRPEAFEIYVRYRSAVDQNNQARQGSAAESRQSLEDAWQTKRWQHRTFSFILGVTEANVMFAHNYLHPEKQLDLMQVRKVLAKQLLFNPFIVEDRLEEDSAEEGDSLESPSVKRSRLGNAQAHTLLSLGKSAKGYSAQLRCRTCHVRDDGRRRRTTTFCSCDPTVGVCRHCFGAHLSLFIA